MPYNESDDYNSSKNFGPRHPDFDWDEYVKSCKRFFMNTKITIYY